MPPKKKEEAPAPVEPEEKPPPEEEEEGPGRVAINFSLGEVASLPCDLETIVCLGGFCAERRSTAAPSSSAPSGWELPKDKVIRQVSQPLYDDLVSRKLQITLRDAERENAVIGEATLSLLPLLHGQTEVAEDVTLKLTEAYYSKWFPEAEEEKANAADKGKKGKGGKEEKKETRKPSKPPPEESPDLDTAASKSPPPPPPPTTIRLSVFVPELVGPAEDRECWTTVTLSVGGVFGLPDKMALLGLGDVVPAPAATPEESPYVADHVLKYNCTMLGEYLGEGQLVKPKSAPPAPPEGGEDGEVPEAPVLSEEEWRDQQEQCGLSVFFKEATAGAVKYRGAAFVREFRRMLNNTGGIWFYFWPEEKVSTDPKKPNPPECATVAKHFAGRAWLDLRALIEPGAKAVSARCELSGEGVPEMAEAGTLQSSRSFVRLALELSHDLTPPPAATTRVTLPQLVPQQKGIQKFPSSVTASTAYNEAVQRSFAAICRECGPEGPSGGLPKGASVSAAVELLQKSGVYSDLKEDLRVAIIRVFRERLRKDTSVVPGAILEGEAREKLLSGTYAHLKTAMFQVLDEIRQSEPEFLPEQEGREKLADAASNDGGGGEQPEVDEIKSDAEGGGSPNLAQALQNMAGAAPAVPRRGSYGKSKSPNGGNTPSQGAKRSNSKMVSSGDGTPTKAQKPIIAAAAANMNPVRVALKESEEARKAKEALGATVITGLRCDRLAYEAELIGNWNRAAELNQSKLVLQEFQHEPKAWIAYAKFCGRSRGRQDAAEEALRQAVGLFQEAVPHTEETALEADLMLAALLLDRGRHEMAIKVFRTWHEKNFAEPFFRFLLGLALFLFGETAEAEHLLESAGKPADWFVGLPDASAVADKLSAFRESGESADLSMYVTWLERLVEFGLPELVFTFIDQCSTLSPRDIASEPIALVDAKAALLERDYQAAAARLEPVVERGPASQETWRLLGECYFQLQDFDRALQALQTALSFEKKFEDPAVYVRLGSVLLVKKRWKQARDAFLRSIQYKSTAEAWSGVAYAELRSEECQMCYEALCEANLLDNDRPDVWAQFTLVHLRLENWGAADKACEHCLTLSQRESAADQAGDLLMEVATEYMRRDREPLIAEAAVRRSIQSRDTWQSHSILADVLARRQLLEKAILESQVAIQMLTDQPDLRKPIFDKALAHCETLGDPALAEALHAVQKMADEALGAAKEEGP
jgi:tetratricopeptide (TPR) repeat protein